MLSFGADNGTLQRPKPLVMQLPAAYVHASLIIRRPRQTNDPTPRPVLSGVYHDRWQKTPSGWHITQRTLRHDHQKPYLSQ
jgi:hypothetical protein